MRPFLSPEITAWLLRQAGVVPESYEAPAAPPMLLGAVRSAVAWGWISREALAARPANDTSTRREAVMSAVNVWILVERGDEELELDVRGDVSTYVPARTSGPADGWSPAEGGDAEIMSVTHAGAPWTGELTEKEADEAREKLLERAAEAVDGGPDYPDDDGEYEAACEREYDDGSGGY